MKPSTANFLLTKVLGWHPDPDFPVVEKALMLGAPHTSVWDFVISYLYARSHSAPLHILVKEAFFFWPVGPVIRRWGAIPLKKKAGVGGASAVMQMVEAFKNNDNIWMGLAPEGPASRSRSGKPDIILLPERQASRCMQDISTGKGNS